MTTTTPARAAVQLAASRGSTILLTHNGGNDFRTINLLNKFNVLLCSSTNSFLCYTTFARPSRALWSAENSERVCSFFVYMQREQAVYLGVWRIFAIDVRPKFSARSTAPASIGHSSKRVIDFLRASRARLSASCPSFRRSQSKRRFFTMSRALATLLTRSSSAFCSNKHFFCYMRIFCRRGTDRLLVVSAYPFALPHIVDPMRVECETRLRETMSAMFDEKTGSISYVATNRPISFSVDFERDIGAHDSFVPVSSCKKN